MQISCSLPALVEVARAERLGVAGAELEDVAHLDRGLDADPRRRAGRGRPPRPCARRPTRPRSRGRARPRAGGCRARFAPVTRPSQPAAAPRRDHRHRAADRPDEAGLAPKRRDLASSRRAAGAPSAFWSLISLRRWSPAHEHERGLAVRRMTTGMALIERARGHAEHARRPPRSSRAPGVVHRVAARPAAPGRPSTGCGVALAISTLAA